MELQKKNVGILLLGHERVGVAGQSWPQFKIFEFKIIIKK